MRLLRELSVAAADGSAVTVAVATAVAGPATPSPGGTCGPRPASHQPASRGGVRHAGASKLTSDPHLPISQTCQQDISARKPTSEYSTTLCCHSARRIRVLLLATSRRPPHAARRRTGR
ncbi:hypothetical protein E2C01_033271 [Portunus trituberculatus]|uniref:Uncharacterized protein n=1 Tax=Portunus trituberculatus TaxID=210409 RepID=A0A5B7F543_PORTR|nr:hypothetical protein [Portunus trituberculatus]